MTSLAGVRTPDQTDGTDLSTVLGGLGAALRAVLAAAQELEPVLRAKQQALVENRPDRLEPLVQREGELSSRLSELEFQRQVRSMELAQALGLTDTEPRLGDLLAAAAGLPGQEDVRATAQDLVRQLEQLGRVNADNAFLSNNLLQYTQFLLQLMHDGTAQPGYRSDGKVARPAAGRELLDYRI
jgi:flagellar biosynthesis/type III secretory pathway chaperone